MPGITSAGAADWHAIPLGPEVFPLHRFEVWAPRAHQLQVITAAGNADTLTHMVAVGDGWWTAEVPAAGPGTDYAFLIDDHGQERPDPRSRRLPSGVHGRSRVYPEDFSWTDGDWTGRPLPGAVIYELHIATFTPGATFDTAIDRLDYLVDLGVTHIELLPVNAVNGTWNWGYDGVSWYAVHEPLGGPDGLKRFVNACHTHGLAVILDVVYNHLGPSGNYLPEFGPYLKTGRNTWGDLINLDGEDSDPVRQFIIDNVRQWLVEFHIDALRLDAVHALIDNGPQHILAEISGQVDRMRAGTGRPLTLIAESDLNDPRMITAREAGGRGMDGQWADDVHHALHAVLTGENHGYYRDFASIGALAKVLGQAFLHDGSYSSFRGRRHGRPVDRAVLPGYRFVVCLQNHDQVGNRAVGDRLPELTDHELLKVGAVLLLTSAFTPMLFMGEEWAATTRWPFFTSHPEPELGEATGKGRLAEFSEHGWDVTAVIDPQDPAAYQEAILNWEELAGPGHADILATYRTLLALRRREPDLADPLLAAVDVDYSDADRWLIVHRGRFRVVANLADRTSTLLLDRAAEQLAYSTSSAVSADGRELQLPPRSAAVVQIQTGAPAARPAGPGPCPANRRTTAAAHPGVPTPPAG